MAKITDLPVASPLSGTEPVIVVQDGEARQSTIGAVVEEVAQPFVDQTQDLLADATGRTFPTTGIAPLFSKGKSVRPLRYLLDSNVVAEMVRGLGLRIFAGALGSGVKLTDQPSVSLFDRVFRAPVGGYFQEGRKGWFRLLIDNNEIYSIDKTRGLYPRKLRLPASATIDDQPTVALVDRISGGFPRTIETATYTIVGYVDGSGKQQIYSRSKVTGQRVDLTSGAVNRRLDSVIGDNKVIYYDDALAHLRWVPADGSGGPYRVKATDTVLFVGDSMQTSGGSGVADEFAAANPTRTVLIGAIGGITSQKAAMLVDAIAHTVTVTGGTIPTSGSVNVTLSTNFLLGSAGSTTVLSIRYRIAGVSGKLVWTPDGLGGGTMVFTPSVYPGEPVAVAGAVPGKVLSLYATGADPSSAASIDDAMAGVVVTGPAINDLASDGTYNQATTLANIAAIKARRTSIERKDLHLTVTNGPYDLPVSMGGSVATAATSATRLTRIDAFNAALRAAYPGEICDRIQRHIDAGGASTVNVNGTDFTVLTGDPTSGAFIGTDGRHENATGQTATAALITTDMTNRSY